MPSALAAAYNEGKSYENNRLKDVPMPNIRKFFVVPKAPSEKDLLEVRLNTLIKSRINALKDETLHQEGLLKTRLKSIDNEIDDVHESLYAYSQQKQDLDRIEQFKLHLHQRMQDLLEKLEQRVNDSKQDPGSS
jgi:hypothetical protein